MQTTAYPKTLFLHGRPAPHPFHEALARSIDADLLPVDFVLRYHDRHSSRWYRNFSWLLSGLFLPRKGYQVVLCESPYPPPVIAKTLCLLGRGQKIATLLSDHTAYFMKSGFYPAGTTGKLRGLLRRFDHLICGNNFTGTIARQIVGPDKPISIFRSGVSRDRLAALTLVEPNLEGSRLLFIASGPSGFRAWYKGIDFLFEVFDRVAMEVPDSLLDIVGDWDADYQATLLGKFPRLHGRVRFVGAANDLALYADRIAGSCLCLHLSRGDAGPVSVLEAMAAGLPVIVSDQTGMHEAVALADPKFVVPLDPLIAAARLLGYLRSPVESRLRLSSSCRLVAQSYTQEESIEDFRRAIGEVVLNSDNGVPNSRLEGRS